MQVLSEHLTFDQAKVVVESSNEGKDLYMKGICIQGNVKNANQRVYPTFEINKAVQKISDTISGGQSVLGEVDHPEDLKINLDRVSHMITELKPEGDNFIGEAKIMSTPMGEIVKNLMDEGATLGVSSRGMGSLDQRGGANYVRSDFKLATAGDIVADPSAPNAFVEGIMEGKEWVWDNGILKSMEVERYKEEIEKTKRAELAEKKASIFKDFLNKI